MIISLPALLACLKAGLKLAARAMPYIRLHGNLTWWVVGDLKLSVNLSSHKPCHGPVQKFTPPGFAALPFSPAQGFSCCRGPTGWQGRVRLSPYPRVAVAVSFGLSASWLDQGRPRLMIVSTLDSTRDKVAGIYRLSVCVCVGSALRHLLFMY